MLHTVPTLLVVHLRFSGRRWVDSRPFRWEVDIDTWEKRTLEVRSNHRKPTGLLSIHHDCHLQTEALYTIRYI
jgi:hypothetical protein